MSEGPPKKERLVDFTTLNQEQGIGQSGRGFSGSGAVNSQVVGIASKSHLLQPALYSHPYPWFKTNFSQLGKPS